MKSVFVSYDHDDQHFLNELKSVKNNQNNSVNFIDRSLSQPVRNDHGDIIRRMPSDNRASPVTEKIKLLLQQSSKLLVLIGRDTHSSEWVKWEIDTFRDIKGDDRNILLMRVSGDKTSGAPGNARELKINNWDVSGISNWL